MSTPGPEDSPRWSHPSNTSKAEPIQACHGCKNPIALYHCENVGCPWCARCGSELRKKAD